MAPPNAVVRLAVMQTWLVCARGASGRERPIGLVTATSEQSALARARTKAGQMGTRVAVDETIVIRRAGTD